MTEDVLEAGGRRSGRGWWVVAAVVAGALGVAAVNAGEGAPRPAASATPSASPSPEPVTTYDVPEPVVEPSVGVDVTPTLDGPTALTAPAATTRHDPLLLGGGVLLRLRPGNPTGRQVTHVHGVMTWFVEVAGGTVVVDTYGEHGEDGYAAFVPTGARASRSLGDAADVRAAADGAHVWASDKDPSHGVAVGLRRIDPRTGRTSARVTLPPGTGLVGEVGRGLVLKSYTEGTPSGIWDHRTRTYVHRWAGDDPVAVEAGHVVLSRVACDVRCWTVARPDGTVRARLHAVTTPAVSPDGRWAAAYQPSANGMSLVVHALGTDTATTVERSDVTTQANAAFGWSRDSRRLYVAVSAGPDRGQVALWRVGTRAVELVSDYHAQDVAAE